MTKSENLRREIDCIATPLHHLRFALDRCDQATKESLTSRVNDVLYSFQAVYPGLRLASAYEVCRAMAAFDLIGELAGAASTLTGEDWRVLGAARRMQGQLLDAEDALERAVALGEEAARIDLARTLSFVERGAEAWQELNKLDFASLSRADQAYAYRLRAELKGELYSYSIALEDARLAKRIAEGIPERPLVLPWCQGTLAGIYEQLGEDQKALRILRDAANNNTQGFPYLYVLADIARLETKLGNYVEARMMLDEIRLKIATPQAERGWTLLWIDLLWCEGRLEDALDSSLNMARSAEADFDPLLATKGYLRAALLGAHLGDSGQALAALYRAEELARSPSMQALTAGFGATVNLRLGLVGAAQAMTMLHQARDRFATRCERLDERQMQLHACEAARHISEHAFQVELQTLRTLMCRVGHSTMLARDWHLFPELSGLLSAEDAVLLGAAAPEAVKIWTLNRMDITWQGKVVRTGIRKSVECLAYFLEHGPSSLAVLLRDVFPELGASQARNQFHQLRHRLREAVPGLDIIFEDGLYRLHCERPIWWDLAAWRLGVLNVCKPEFLPSSGSDWVLELNAVLEQNQTRSA